MDCLIALLFWVGLWEVQYGVFNKREYFAVFSLTLYSCHHFFRMNLKGQICSGTQIYTQTKQAIPMNFGQFSESRRDPFAHRINQQNCVPALGSAQWTRPGKGKIGGQFWYLQVFALPWYKYFIFGETLRHLPTFITPLLISIKNIYTIPFIVFLQHEMCALCLFT